MEKPQRKPNQRHEGTKPRKVRFKLASSYSGRVLKHVYEDGQELDSPEEKYPHSFVHHKIPPDHLEVGQLLEFEDNQEDQQGPPAGLIAQRINVYRGMDAYKPAADESQAAARAAASSVLDFGKIIIYTSNLRIIKAPARAPEAPRRCPVPPADLQGSPKAKERGRRRRSRSKDRGEKQLSGTEKELPDTDMSIIGMPEHLLSRQGSYRTVMQLDGCGDLCRVCMGEEADTCQHCGGSGCAPCSLCHGSKLSMLANRFNESISDLRCQACYPHGLEKCQSCSSEQHRLADSRAPQRTSQ